jgi:hypothetical protein
MNRKSLSFTRAMALLALVALSLSGLRATTVVAPEFSTLVNESDFVIHAVVRNVTAEKRDVTRGRKIVTRVEFDVLEVVAGKAPTTVTLEFLGGRVGTEALAVEGMPQFKVGDEDVLFVRDSGKSICPLYAMMHGRYAVKTEPATGRKYIARADGTALEATAQIATALHAAGPANSISSNALSPSDFIQQIQASVRPDARFNRAQN